MANTFRVTGNFYVSKAGNDANDGTTPELARATITAGLNLINANGQTLVIGTGMYEETINKSMSFSYNVRSDGEVKIRGIGTNDFTASGQIGNWYNITFENYNNINFISSSSVNNCTFITCGNVGWWATNGGVNANFNYCKFVNVSRFGTGQHALQTSTAGMSVDYCIFINCNAYFLTCTNSYFNSASYCRHRKSGSVASDMNYNNIMCPIQMQNTNYTDLAAQQAAVSTINAQSINLPPKFNNVAKYDFTLQYDSPHIGAASNSLNNIGGTNYAVTSVFSTSHEWAASNPLVTRVNIDQSGQDAVITTGQNSGYVISAPWKAFANPTEIMQMVYNGALNFNKSAASGSPSNNNVPDANVFAATNPNGGGNPDRLSIEARWSTSDEMPAQDSDWTNGNYGTAGLFYKFEINAQPKLYFNPNDNLYYGNGSASYQPGNAFTFPITWIQFRVTLTNLYLNA